MITNSFVLLERRVIPFQVCIRLYLLYLNWILNSSLVIANLVMRMHCILNHLLLHEYIGVYSFCLYQMVPNNSTIMIDLAIATTINKTIASFIRLLSPIFIPIQTERFQVQYFVFEWFQNVYYIFASLPAWGFMSHHTLHYLIQAPFVLSFKYL